MKCWELVEKLDPCDERIYTRLERAYVKLLEFKPLLVSDGESWMLEHRRLQLERQQRDEEQLNRRALTSEFPF